MEWQLTHEQHKDAASAVRTIRKYLKDSNSVGEKEFMDACFRASLALIFSGLRPHHGNIQPKHKRYDYYMRDRWGWDVCFGKPWPWVEGATTHVFNYQEHITIRPDHFTLEQAIMFAKDMEWGGFLKQINKRRSNSRLS